MKKDQRTGELTEGIVKDLLTSAPYHHHGIKVRLIDGQIGLCRKLLKTIFRTHQIIN
ncbi:YwbE family protein [Empedobacter sp. UBA7248]|uniref:YwbE family protein n=1 Tax=Empedobacter sp. UBA7248 TaxID=1946448 RepID=UPI0025C359E0|nr:YwbE family protein [Empedobacter sp. UBA7248]